MRSDDPIGHGRMTPYLLADAEPVSTPDLVRAMANALGVTPRLFAVPPGLSALRRSVRGARADGGAPGRIARSRHHGVSHPLWLDAADFVGGRARRRVARSTAAIINPFCLRELLEPNPVRWPPCRPVTRGAHHAWFHAARRRLGAGRDGKHARAVHGQRRRRRSGVSQGQGAGLAHRRVRNASARDQYADEARGGGGQAIGTHAGNSAAHRPQPARGNRSRRARASAR